MQKSKIKMIIQNAKLFLSSKRKAQSVKLKRKA